MDQNLPFTPTLNPAPSANSTFSPITKLFKLAWDKVQNHLLKLFLLTVIFFVAGLVLFVISALIMTVAGFFSPITSSVPYSSGTAVTAMITFVLLIIAMIVGMIALNIAVIVVLAETQPTLSLIGLYKHASKKILPMLILGLLTGFIVVGGLVMLVIPGILFSILLTMSGYYVVLDNLSPLEAMRKSVFVVSKNFGVIFMRIAALFGFSFVAGIIINIFSSQSGLVSLFGSVISLIFNLIYGWFSIALMMLVFQETKKSTGDGKGKLLLMVIVAVIGWVIIFGGSYMLFQTAANNRNTLPVSTERLFNDSSLDLNNLNETIATPVASIRPASPSASVKPTATPKVSATPKASAATSSANR